MENWKQAVFFFFLLLSLLSEVNCSEVQIPYLKRCKIIWNSKGRASHVKQLFIDYQCCSKLRITPANQLYSYVRQHAHLNHRSLPSDLRFSSRVNPIIKALLMVNKLWSNREICLKTRQKHASVCYFHITWIQWNCKRFHFNQHLQARSQQYIYDFLWCQHIFTAKFTLYKQVDKS